MKAEIELPDLSGGTYSGEWRIAAYGEVYLSLDSELVISYTHDKTREGCHHIINASPELRAIAIDNTREIWRKVGPKPNFESQYYGIIKRLKELEAQK